MTFGLPDYLRMLRARGPRLPLAHFWQAHRFDLQNGTDTHVWQPKDHYSDRPKNFEHGVLYMASWTNIIRTATREALDHLNLPATDVQFTDVGCGKGKVLCVWHQMFGNDAHLTGIDYSAPLIDICASNLAKLNAQASLHTCDAATFTFPTAKPTTLVYLYNPFDETILSQVARNLSGVPCVVIYNNPQHLSALTNAGFLIIRSHAGWHPNATYALLSNGP